MRGYERVWEGIYLFLCVCMCVYLTLTVEGASRPRSDLIAVMPWVGSENREQGTENREQRTENREQKMDN
jgi:hypothetical protein